MNKKFVKENKKPLREFLSAIVAAIVAGKASGKIDRAINKNPELKRQRDKVQKMGKEFDAKIKAHLKKYPEDKRFFSQV